MTKFQKEFLDIIQECNKHKPAEFGLVDRPCVLVLCLDPLDRDYYSILFAKYLNQDNHLNHIDWLKDYNIRFALEKQDVIGLSPIATLVSSKFVNKVKEDDYYKAEFHEKLDYCEVGMRSRFNENYRIFMDDDSKVIDYRPGSLVDTNS